MAQKFGMGFLRVKFWPRDFFGFCLKPSELFWVFIFAPIRSSLSLEIQSTPTGDLNCLKTRLTKIDCLARH